MSDRTFARKKATASNFSQPSLVSPTTPTLVNPTRGFGLSTNNVVQTAAESSTQQQEVQSADEGSLEQLTIQEKPLTHDINRISFRRPQTKLTVGEPGDKYEQEANWMANRVMRMVVPDKLNPPSVQPVQESLQRKCAACEEEKIQTKRSIQLATNGSLQAGNNIESRLNSSKGGGNPLPEAVRSFMEPRFGADFSNVRVHTDSTAVQMNRELNAQAFTHGSDVYFGEGKSPGNNELTAHELTHVVQQTESVQRAPVLQDNQLSTSNTPIYTDEDNQRWNNIKGPDLIAAVSAELQKWINFRNSPNSGAWKDMPGQAASNAIALVRDNFEHAPSSLRERASRELINSASGPNSLMYLQEMVGFWPVDFVGVDTVFNGVNRTHKPGHTYTLEVLPTETIIKIIDQMPVVSDYIKINTVRVAYQNDFGWFWSQEFGIAGIQIGVSIGIESKEKEKEKEGRKITWRETTFKPGLAPLKIGFSGIAPANPTPLRYWGWENFSNAKVVAGKLGPSASVKLMGAGGDFGIGIPFVSFMTADINDDLSFPKLETTSKLSGWPTLKGVYKGLKEDKPLTISFGTGEIGVGLVFAREGTLEHTTYSLTSTVEWVIHKDKPLQTTILPFDTGDAALPPTTKAHIQPLIQTLQAECARSQNEYSLVHQSSILPEKAFKVHLDVRGWSSRTWRSAKNEQLKREKNVQLSSQRAEAVVFYLLPVLPGEIILENQQGMGSGVVPSGANTPVAVANNQEANALWKKEYEQWQANNYKDNHEPTADEKKAKIQELDERYGQNSNDSSARRVDVTVWYEKYEMQGKLPNQSVSGEPPASSPRPEEHSDSTNAPDPSILDALAFSRQLATP